MTRGLHRITNGLLIAALAGSVGLSALPQHFDAPAPEPSQTAVGVTVPAWQADYAETFPGCVEALPSGVVPSRVVVVKRTGDVSAMNFDRAVQVTHNRNAADDVWVVGACR